jgi:hypothetical protein
MSRPENTERPSPDTGAVCFPDRGRLSGIRHPASGIRWMFLTKRSEYVFLQKIITFLKNIVTFNFCKMGVSESKRQFCHFF